MVHLKVLSSDSQDFVGKELPLDGDEITIGRQADCTILVPDAAVSRRHAKIVRTPEGLLLVDDGGRNGLFVNGERLTHRLLEDGDVIRVGHTEMVFAGKSQGREVWRKPTSAAPARTPVEDRLEQTTMLEPPDPPPAPPKPERRAVRPMPARAAIAPLEDKLPPCPVCAAPMAAGADRCDDCGAIASPPHAQLQPRAAGATSLSRALAAFGLLTAGVLLVATVLVARDQGLIGHHAGPAVQTRPAAAGGHPRVP
jgi:predicted component of type VI protein secretion system